MTEGIELQGKNRLLRDAVKQAAGNDAALTVAVFKIAVKQSTNASLEQVQANLQERAWEIIKLRRDLKDAFKGLLPGL